MIFSKEKLTAIKQYILENIASGSADIPSKTSDAFGISQKTAYKYINEMIDEGIIEKSGTRYELISKNYSFRIRRKADDVLEEDEIYDKYIAPVICHLPQNINEIWAYCFSEMMNNAIDHSEATSMNLFIQQNYLDTTILIIDNGIGIFHKIQEHFGFHTIDEAITELFKGKLTTDNIHHSGEGIFFTSQILDCFAAISDGKIFSHNKYVKVRYDLDNLPDIKKYLFKTGTAIFMKLCNFSHKKTQDIFDKYSNDDGKFTKTSIPLRNVYETYPVSRSQAKRLCKRFDNFKEVTLDFDEINDVGQGFAHEIFVVFAKQHPEVSILYCNANKNIVKMINHVTDSSI